MKICPVCKTTEGEFYEKSRTTYCKSCNREYGQRNYQENKERYFRLAKERNKRLDELINSYKDKPCADCGIKYPHYIMDFDHLEEKSFNISYMRRHRMAFDKIIAEISKCEVVCSNCHRERTNQRNPSRYSKGDF